MSTDIEQPYPYWDINKSKYEEIDLLPLMTAPGTVFLIIVSYLLYTLKIGPSYMKNKEPYKLTTVLLLYNIVQITFSSYLVKVSFQQIMRVGLAPKTCYVRDVNYRNEILYSMWLYFIAKVTELLDTVFFVMRKKFNQVTFLHVYHHAVMVAAAWLFLKHWPSETLLFLGFLNSLVHVFMYTYYGLAGLGPKVEKYIFWKKYITKFQMVQFVCMLIQHIIAIRRSECEPAYFVIAFVAFHALFFFKLFMNFYMNSYTKQGKIPSLSVSQNIEKEK